MPPIIPIIIGIAIAVSAAPIAIGVLGSLLLFNLMAGIGLSLIIGGIGRALQKRPNFGNLQNDPLNRTVTVRQPLATARVVYGAARIGGIYTYLETTGTNNEFFHMVISLAASKLQSIGTMYFDNVAVSLDGSGNATTSPYTGLVHVEKNLGDRDQASFSGLDSASTLWTSAHRQRGRASVYVRLKWDQNAFPHGVPNITFDVTGFNVYDPRLSGTQIAYSNNSALCMADYLTNSDYGLGALKKVPVLGSMWSASGMTVFNAANLADSDVTNTGLTTDSAVANSWAKIDLGSSLTAEPVEIRIWMMGSSAYAGIFDVEYSDDNSTWFKAATGLKPNLILTTRGILNKFFLSPNGPHRYWRLLLTNTPGGTGAITEVALYESLVDKTQLISAANTCDESVSLAAGGTEARYDTDGAFDTAELPQDAIAALAGAMGGYMVYVSGRFYVYAAAWRTPDSSLSFDEDDLAGAVKVTTKASRRELFNTVRGTFVSSQSNWEATDFPAYSKDSYIQEDDGEVMYLDMTLPFTISVARAQRLAKLVLERSRRQIQVQARFKLTAYLLQAPDVISLSIARFGWINKTFEVISSQLSSEADANGDAPVLYVDTVLQETDSNAYDWNAANDEKTFTGAPGITLVSAQVCQPVTSLTGTAFDIIAPDSSRTLGVILNWTAPADQFVLKGGFIHVYFKKHTDSGYTQAATLDGSAVTATITGILSGVAYDFKVVAQNSHKVFSADTILSNQTYTIQVSGMLTYRPLSNPLTASDVGSTATISVAGFTMRIQGVGDKSVSSGSITGLSFNTLYYIYYDDVNAAGGSVTFVATTTKENAINGAGRFFVGSIQTPVDGGFDTTGNNDGGSSAQQGMLNILQFGSAISSGGTGTVTNILNSVDGDTSTYANLSVTGPSGFMGCGITFSVPPGLSRKYSSLKIYVIWRCLSNTLGSQAGNVFIISASWNGGTGTIATLAFGTTQALVKSSLTLPAGVNAASVTVQASLVQQSGVGAAQVDIAEIWMEGIE